MCWDSVRVEVRVEGRVVVKVGVEFRAGIKVGDGVEVGVRFKKLLRLLWCH